MTSKTPIIGIIDYGYGNIFSVEKALAHLNAQPMVLSSPKALAEQQDKIDKLILPGQGAFPNCAAALQPFLPILLPMVQKHHKALLGICVGMQLLVEIGYEFQKTAGLRLIRGEIKHFQELWQTNGILPPNATLPNHQPPTNQIKTIHAKTTHTDQQSPPPILPLMAWKKITRQQPAHALLAGIKPDDYFYFVHSYVLMNYDNHDLLALCHYGADYPAIIAKGHIAGIQCHPEKSQKAGLQFLQNFINWQPTP